MDALEKTLNDIQQNNDSLYTKLLMTSEDIPVTGRLVSVSAENVIADAIQLWDSNLLDNQENINKRVKKAIELLDEELKLEIKDRIAGDEALGKRIDQEIEDRKAADTVITNNLNKEIQDRKDGDTLITNNLNQEIDNRKKGDEALGQALKDHEDKMATTTEYGHVRLIESLQDPDQLDVVTIGLLKTWIDNMEKCCSEVKKSIEDLDDRIEEIEKKEQIEVVVTPNPAYVYVGYTTQLNALVTNAEDPSVEWSSSDTSIATVDLNGTVTGVAEGTVTITATSIENDWIFDSSEVIVSTKPAITISIDPTSLTLDLNGSWLYQFSATITNAEDTSVTWTTGNSSIATVDNSGIVTAKSEGTTVVTVTSVEDPTKSASATLTVIKSAINPTSVDVTNVTVVVGSTAIGSYKVYPTDASYSSVTFSTADSSIATIDQNCVITGVKAGETTYTVTIDGTLTGTGTITVLDNVVHVTSITAYDVETKTGYTVYASYEISPSDATNKNVVFSIADSNIASINSDGLITGNKVGETTYTVTSVSDATVSATAKVTVTASTEFDVVYDYMADSNSADGIILSDNYATISVEPDDVSQHDVKVYADGSITWTVKED